MLMWLLLLALPLQGYAAATTLNCGAGHHPMSAAVASVAIPVASGEPRHVHHGDTTDPAASAGHHHADGTSKSKCSACATCCVGAALPATALVFVDAVPDRAPTRFFSIGPIGFLTDGPDRPPRTHLV